MKYTTLLSISALLNISHGALVTTYTTGATGTSGDLTFTNGGSWTGDGTVQPMTADLGNPNSAPSAALVNGFSNGVLHLSDVSLAGNGSPYTPAGLSATHTIAIADGTANITALFNGAGNQFNFSLQPTAGTSSIKYTMELSHALHSRRRTGNAFLPWLGSLEMPDSAQVQVTYGGVYTLTSATGMVADATQVLGIDGGIAAAGKNGRNFGTVTAPTADTLTYFTTLSANETHLNSIIAAESPNIHPGSTGIAYGAGTQADSILQDGERVHADSICWEITADSGNFTGDEVFIFSFDGNRSAANTIPEPTSTALLGLGGLALLARRNRK